MQKYAHSLLLIFKLFITLIFMSILSAGMTVSHVCSWCLSRPKQSIGPPGTEVTDCDVWL